MIAAALLSVCLGTAIAQDQDKPAVAQKVEMNELEKKFAQTLKGALFVGRWCLVKDGKMGPSKDERYEIESAEKFSEDTWVIKARMQWGKNDITVPIGIKLVWAGDTPIITIDKLWIPGAGSYSARVMIYNDTYAGSWSGAGYGGLLNGTIAHPEKAE